MRKFWGGDERHTCKCNDKLKDITKEKLAKAKRLVRNEKKKNLLQEQLAESKRIVRNAEKKNSILQRKRMRQQNIDE